METGKIAGLAVLSPKLNSDSRGSLDVIFAKGWPGVPTVEQWNVVRSQAKVLRGMHVHSRYDEIYASVVGRMFIVLKDARRRSETFGVTMTQWIDNVSANHTIVVPAGVAHGVLFTTHGILTYGLSSPWTGRNEFNCRWDDPEIGVDWPEPAPLLSKRDTVAGSYADMVAAVNADLAPVT
jgi:dTDP-4-dehydrorhamnose 3,5-epimerase